MGSALTAPGTVAVRGKPLQLDVIWRPVWRLILGALGVTGSALLVLQGDWLWAPIPLASALLLFELVFWIRGDRAVRLTARGDQLQVVDRKRGQTLQVDLGAVQVASMGVRTGPGSGEIDAFVVLYDVDRPLFAARLRAKAQAPPFAADLDALQPILGGQTGMVRGLAPSDRLVRQIIIDHDGKLLAHLEQHIPAAAWTRTAVRAWRGTAPALDYLGQHLGPPDVLLVLDGDTWRTHDRLTGEVRTGTLAPGDGGRASRLMDLVDGQDGATSKARLPLLVWDLARDLRLAMPCPIAGHHGPEVGLDTATLHTHLAEGANLVWWMLDRVPAGRIPAGLTQALQDSRVANRRPPPTLRRHLA